MTTRAKKKQKDEPQWRAVERVVALLEATLDPGAVVQHDVHLPDLSTPGHSRQCDVVVTTGPDHRRTRTIVEVQRRGRKVEITHFDAWVAKMRAIGAQHLICVSASGYPSSVKDKAAQLGPTVRLATLKELERGSPLLSASLGQVLVRHEGTTAHRDIELLVTDPAHVGPTNNELSYDASLFRTSSGETLSLNQIAQRLLNAHSAREHLRPGDHRIHFETSAPLTFLLNEAAGPIRLRFVSDVLIHDFMLPCDVLEYKQLVDDGTLAWVLAGRAPRPGGDGNFELTITFRPGPDGRLMPKLLTVVGLATGDIFSAEVAGHRAGPIVMKAATA